MISAVAEPRKHMTAIKIKIWKKIGNKNTAQAIFSLLLQSIFKMNTQMNE